MVKIILFRGTFKFALVDVPGENPDELRAIVDKWFNQWFLEMSEKAEKEGYKLLLDPWDDAIGGHCYRIETDTHEDLAAAHDWVQQNLDFWQWYC